MKQILLSIFFAILIVSCKSLPEFKTIDFESFEISVPQNWKKFEMKGTDSYVGGIITEQKDTLIFDIGMYSGDAIKEDFPLVYDKKGYAELSKKEKDLLKKARHLIVDSITGNIDFKKYLTQKFIMQKFDCFQGKLITPLNKEYGTTGLYIDSLAGSKKDFNQTKMSFYGRNLKEKTEKEFIIAIKSIKLKEYCNANKIKI